MQLRPVFFIVTKQNAHNIWHWHIRMESFLTPSWLSGVRNAPRKRPGWGLQCPKWWCTTPIARKSLRNPRDRLLPDGPPISCSSCECFSAVCYRQIHRRPARVPPLPPPSRSRSHEQHMLPFPVCHLDTLTYLKTINPRRSKKTKIYVKSKV